MAKEAKGSNKEKKHATITFKCLRCQRQMPLEEMRIVTRFFPPLVVCCQCEDEVR